MIYSETGDIKRFITVSSFGKSLLNQINLFEEAFFIFSQEIFQALSCQLIQLYPIYVFLIEI